MAVLYSLGCRWDRFGLATLRPRKLGKVRQRLVSARQGKCLRGASKDDGTKLLCWKGRASQSGSSLQKPCGPSGICRAQRRNDLVLVDVVGVACRVVDLLHKRLQLDAHIGVAGLKGNR